MAPTYEMEYLTGSGEDSRTVKKFFAADDNEAVEIAKQSFLSWAGYKVIPNDSTLESVCREPENLLKTKYKPLVKRNKVVSLIEK